MLMLINMMIIMLLPLMMMMMMMMMMSHLLESSMSPQDFSILTCHAFIIMVIVGLCSIMR